MQKITKCNCKLLRALKVYSLNRHATSLGCGTLLKVLLGYMVTLRKKILNHWPHCNHIAKNSNCRFLIKIARLQGVKLTFFPVICSNLAPKYFKVVANSKKLVVIMTHTHKQFLPCHCTREIKLLIDIMLSKYLLELQRGHYNGPYYYIIILFIIYNVKGYLNPRWRLVTMIDLCSKSCMYCILKMGLMRNFAADLKIFNNH